MHFERKFFIILIYIELVSAYYIITRKSIFGKAAMTLPAVQIQVCNLSPSQALCVCVYIYIYIYLILIYLLSQLNCIHVKIYL